MEVQQYEFDRSQNALIKHLADKMHFVSYFLIAIGLFTAGKGIFALLKGSIDSIGVFALLKGGIDSIIGGIVQILTGIWTHKAAGSFGRIVHTEGSDIENLMGALGELRKLYVLQSWLLIMPLAFATLGVGLTIVGGVLSLVR